MKTKVKPIQLVVWSICFALLSGVLLGHYVNPLVITNTITVEVPTEIPKAMVTNLMESWGESSLNSKELLFDNWVYNFGDLEAKNLVLKCYINVNDVRVREYLYPIGNVASHSYKFFEETADNFPHDSTESTATCHITSCDDNCMLLDKNIPDIWNTYQQND